MRRPDQEVGLALQVNHEINMNSLGAGPQLFYDYVDDEDDEDTDDDDLVRGKVGGGFKVIPGME